MKEEGILKKEEDRRNNTEGKWTCKKEEGINNEEDGRRKKE